MQSPHIGCAPSTAREDWSRFREDWGSWSIGERVGFAIVIQLLLVFPGVLLWAAAVK